MARSASERLRRFYEQFSGDDCVLILINADPDAIASAMAVKRLLWRKAANVTISNINVIKRPDNLAMVRLLGIGMTYVNDIDRSRFTKVVIVDSQPNHHELFGRFKPTVIIDHHPDTGATAPFTDIRPNYGATATIMTEFIRAAGIKPSTKLATGLYHAIKTDTSNFERQAQPEDIRAFQFLFRYANAQLARKIEHAEMKIGFLKYFRSALDNRRYRKGKIFVHLGPVINPDVCVLVADFFMRVDAINWSIVSGIYKKHLVVILRNIGLRKSAGNVAKESFGQLGSAGGHGSMARAEIPVAALNGLVDLSDDRKTLLWLINQIEKKPNRNQANRRANDN